MQVTVLVCEDDFDVGAETEALRGTGVGAIASFTGIVRDTDGTGPSQHLIALTLEHYPQMTETEITRIVAEAGERWPLAAVRVIHRVGRLAPQENIVFVGTASAHRDAAFESAAFIMDYLKTKAPFWKKEETQEGAHWVDARLSDDEALEKWKRR